MADLFNLDSELLDNDDDDDDDDLQQQEEDDVAQPTAQDWDDDDDNDNNREEIELPDDLLLLANKQQQPRAVVDDDDDEEALDWQDFVNTATTQQQQQPTAASRLEALPYTRLYAAWKQECQSPELRPLDRAAVAELREAVAAADDGDRSENDDDSERFHGTGNSATAAAAAVATLFRSVRHVDGQRAKFLLADLLHRRLRKIAAHPLRARDLTECMSEAEVQFLREYGAAVERHLRVTVTDHFPQDVWKQLDRADMVDEPCLDRFVFLRTLQDVAVDGGGGDDGGEGGAESHHAAGSCLIVRYRRVRDLCRQGKVELM